MNKFIKQELRKCKTPLPHWSDDTTVIVISKFNVPKVSQDLQIGGKYDIVLEDYVINEPPNFTLSANWNNGTKPPEHHMSVEVPNIMGKMIYVRGCGVSNNVMWEGWIPQKAIKIERII